MYWLDEVKVKNRKDNQILFSKDSTLLTHLNYLLEQQTHKTVVLWALDLAQQAAKKLQSKLPEDTRPMEALHYSKLWASGEITMKLARRKILDCHAMAKELSDKCDKALCHAVGQACAVVHTAKHALGFPIYELSSIVYRYGTDNCRDIIEKRVNEYLELLNYYIAHTDDSNRQWADFLQN